MYRRGLDFSFLQRFSHCVSVRRRTFAATEEDSLRRRIMLPGEDIFRR